MLEGFERLTKPTFKNPSERSFIKFGSMRDRDDAVGIRSGQISLEGCARSFRAPKCYYSSTPYFISSAEVARCFEGCIMGIVASVRAQCQDALEAVEVR
jgi:hypothetical protein